MDYTLSQLFKTLMDQGGSDLHISAGSPPRIRIDGQILPLNLPPLKPEESLELCYNALTENQKMKFEKEKEIDLSFAVRDLARFRANIYFESGAVAGAFRAVPFKTLTLKEIHAPKIFYELCSLKKGLVLITGQTGSGKSTTLSAMIDHINETRFNHIVTIEDPIEFVHHHKNSIINQREIGEDTNSFSSALKSVLRQDPDVIVLGELRDLNTISSALTLAETGHLVFGTLHTNDATSTVNRIIDTFPSEQQNQVKTQLSMTLEAVICQTLPRRINGGRTLAIEIMRINKAISALIKEGKAHQIHSAIQSGQSISQMQTMNQSLSFLVHNNIISRAEAIMHSVDRDELSAMIGQ